MNRRKRWKLSRDGLHQVEVRIGPPTVLPVIEIDGHLIHAFGIEVRAGAKMELPVVTLAFPAVLDIDGEAEVRVRDRTEIPIHIQEKPA